MNNDTKRNTNSILTVRSIGSSYHDVDYLFPSDKDNSATETKSSDTTSYGIWSRCSDYVCNFFIERANDAFNLSPKRLLSGEFYKRTIK